MVQAKVRAVGGRWLNPWSIGWKKPRLERANSSACGMRWVCPNHPEKQGGIISGTAGTPTHRSVYQAFAALMLHLDKYHGIELSEREIREYQRQSRWYNYGNLMTRPPKAG